MAINNIATLARDAMCNALVDRIDLDTPPGLIRIYTAAFATLLAELTFSNPAFGASSTGVATANAITSDSSANATGTAAVCRIVTGTAFTTVFEGTVSTSGADINFNTVAFTTGDSVAITSMTVTMPAS